MDASESKKPLKKYSGCLIQDTGARVLLGRRSYFTDSVLGKREKFVTNVGSGLLEADETWLAGCMRAWHEKVLELGSQEEKEAIDGATLGVSTYRERLHKNVHSRLYTMHVKKRPDVDDMAKTAAHYLDQLTKLEADVTEDGPLQKALIAECQKHTEFELFFWVDFHAVMKAAQQYDQASEKGTITATPVKLRDVGTLDPAFCCLLATEPVCA